MKRSATTILCLFAILATSAVLTSPASAALRVPQVPVLGGTLQAYLTSADGGINVLTDQDATQAWTKTVSNTTTHTIQLQSSPNAGLHTFYMYNSSSVGVPVLYNILSGTAGVLGFSTATFQAGNQLTVNRFDFDGNFLSSQVFAGVDPTGFSFALSGPGGQFYTQDARNPGGLAQAVTYRGTGANLGTWWLCWEETARGAGSDHDFDDLVLLMESVNPTPVSKTSWGQLKTRFR